MPEKRTQGAELYRGIDGCAGGWAGVAMTPELNFTGGVQFWQDAAGMIPAVAAARLALIDIPIGLADGAPGVRRCDRAARRALGVRRSSVFIPPVRQALAAPTYEMAKEINVRVCGKKISIQSWHILPKIGEVDEMLQQNPGLQARLRESHPELCFAQLNGGTALAMHKKTAAGRRERLTLLAARAPKAEAYFAAQAHRLPRALVGLDDLLDAMVLALTAAWGCRYGLLALPATAPFDATGLRMEIVTCDFSAAPPYKPHALSSMGEA